MHARRHRAAGIAAPAGRISAPRAEQRPREYACRAPFPHALHPAKEQGMGKTLRGSKRTQTADDFRVSAHVRPVVWELLPHDIVREWSGCRYIFLWTRHYI